MVGRNLVLFFDGTTNEFKKDLSNVLKLYNLVSRDSDQITYYHPGLGTSGTVDRLFWFGKFVRCIKSGLQSMFGYGVMYNIAKGYEFIMQNYQVGDKIFLFGYSRGAYTARGLAAMIYRFGLLEKDNISMIPYVTELFRDYEKSKDLVSDFKKMFGREVPIHFVGVWDTVSSVGATWSPFSLPSTSKNPAIQNAVHAVSLDERRSYFRANLFTKLPVQNIKEVWFPGGHSDVGGGNSESESGLANVSLNWISREAKKAGLKFRSEKIFEEDLKSPIHDEANKIQWIISVLLPRKLWDYKKNKYIFWWKCNKRRFIPENSILHPSVNLKKDLDSDYSPIYPPSCSDKEFVE